MSALELALIIGATALGSLALAFWIWMLIDCATREPSHGNDKIVWLIIIVVTKLLGAVLYYWIRRPQRIGLHGA